MYPANNVGGTGLVARLFIILLFHVSISSASSGESIQSYVYYGHPVMFKLSDEQRIRYSLGEIELRPGDGTIAASDTVKSTYFCGKESEWQCVRSDDFFFAVNSRWKELPENWEFQETEFYIVGVEKLRILGKRIDTQVICSENPHMSKGSELNCFNYSTRHGLLAIHIEGGVLDERSESESSSNYQTYISVSENGFGSIRK